MSQLLREQPDAARFHRLVRDWRARKMHSSLLEDHILHPAYLSIVGMGERAVPFIIAELEAGSREPWFAALTAITEESPIPDEACGNVEAMAKSWIEWHMRNNDR
jgi:hypothetical protein